MLLTFFEIEQVIIDNLTFDKITTTHPCFPNRSQVGLTFFARERYCNQALKLKLLSPDFSDFLLFKEFVSIRLIVTNVMFLFRVSG